MKDLYKKFLSRENFELSYSRVIHWQNNGYKDFYKTDMKAFSLFLSNNLDQLISEIKESKFEPHNGCVYYIPKKNYLSRPITLLNFIDLLVYQAITNIVMDEIKNDFTVNENQIVFGNIINKDTNTSHYFQFKNWKRQWKTYKKAIKESYNKGYNYISEFDIASFYDCIDHERLLDILKKYGICDEIIELFQKCLKRWTICQTTTLPKRCGIPQGPECSGFWGELYLKGIDDLVVNCHLDIKYLRYADDIKIMSNQEQICHKAIALLDFYCKDSCLIAQSGKIITKKLDAKTINEYINLSGLKLSNISYEYKAKGNLDDATHNKVKKKLKASFDKTSPLYLDKTVIKFAFFKLNKDDEVKEIILKYFNELYLMFEGPIYYLNKFYPTDKTVLDRISSLFQNDDTIFQYNKAVVFNLFKELPFSQNIFESVVRNNNQRYWIVKYYAAFWLKRVKKPELVKFLFEKPQNYFIKREKIITCFDLSVSNEEQYLFAQKFYKDEDMLSLIAFYKYPIYKSFSEDEASDYILNILRLNRSDYIGSYLKSEFKIAKTDSKKLIYTLKKDPDVYNESINDLIKFNEFKGSKYPDIALQAIDLWHNILVDLINPAQNIEYGNKIKLLKNELPYCYNGFDIIHEARNQKTNAHYKDKMKKVRNIITAVDFKTLLEKADLCNMYIELCKFFNAKG